MSLKDKVRKSFSPKEGATNAMYAVPPGWYTGRLFFTEVKDSSNGNAMLRYGWEVAHGEHVGRSDYDFIMLDHTNEDYLLRQEALLASLLGALGFDDVPDEGELQGKLLDFRVTHEDDADYGDPNGKRTRIVAFRAASTDTPTGGPVVDDDDIPF